MKLDRHDFFGHPQINKLCSSILKKSRLNSNRLIIKDVDLQKLLLDNENWLDYVGIKIYIKDKKTFYIKWETL